MAVGDIVVLRGSLQGDVLHRQSRAVLRVMRPDEAAGAGASPAFGLREGRPTPAFDPKIFLATVGKGKTAAEYRKNQRIFSQGDTADAIFYIQRGKVKLTYNGSLYVHNSLLSVVLND